MELFAADGHDAGGCERVTGKSGMRPQDGRAAVPRDQHARRRRDRRRRVEAVHEELVRPRPDPEHGQGPEVHPGGPAAADRGVDGSIRSVRPMGYRRNATGRSSPSSIVWSSGAQTMPSNPSRTATVAGCSVRSTRGWSRWRFRPRDGGARIFLFGPGRLPDADFRFQPDPAAGESPPGTGASGENGWEDSRPSRSVSPAVDGGDRASVGDVPSPDEEGQGADGSKSGATTTDPGRVGREASGRNGAPAAGTTDPEQPTKRTGGETIPDRNATADISTPVPAIALGVDGLTGGDVQWSLTIKGNPHLLIAGLPGMGKTTCLLNLCRQMVTAGIHGIHPIIFSYHRTSTSGLLTWSSPCGSSTSMDWDSIR